MSTLKSNVIEPATGTTLSLGASGDNVLVSSDSLQTNLYKDAGGNTLFTSDGAGTLSNVNSGIIGAGPTLILSQTASDSATVNFTANLDTTYDKYMFVWVNINPATNAQDFTFQCSTDGGSNYNTTMTTYTFRAYHSESDSSTGLTYAAAQDQGQGTSYQAIGHYMGSGADECTSGILYLYTPGSTTYTKQFISRASVMDGSGATTLNDWYAGGYFNTTSALNAISFKMASGNFDGIIKMYGVS